MIEKWRKKKGKKKEERGTASVSCLESSWRWNKQQKKKRRRRRRRKYAPCLRTCLMHTCRLPQGKYESNFLFWVVVTLFCSVQLETFYSQLVKDRTERVFWIIEVKLFINIIISLYIILIIFYNSYFFCKNLTCYPQRDEFMEFCSFV